MRDVFELLLSSVNELGRDLPLHLPVGVTGDADASRLRNAFEASRDVHAIAQDVLAVDKDVAEIDANSKPHLTVRWHVSVPRSHDLLEGNGAFDRGHDRRKFQ